MYRKQVRLGFRSFRCLYGYSIGMVIEIMATVALMGAGLVISVSGFYLLK